MIESERLKRRVATREFIDADGDIDNCDLNE
jgi:hypothetical protein